MGQRFALNMKAKMICIWLKFYKNFLEVFRMHPLFGTDSGWAETAGKVTDICYFHIGSFKFKITHKKTSLMVVYHKGGSQCKCTGLCLLDRHDCDELVHQNKMA